MTSCETELVSYETVLSGYALICSVLSLGGCPGFVQVRDIEKCVKTDSAWYYLTDIPDHSGVTEGSE